MGISKFFVCVVCWLFGCWLFVCLLLFVCWLLLVV